MVTMVLIIISDDIRIYRTAPIQTEFRTVDDGLSEVLNLNAFVQLGDVIEYKDREQTNQTIIRKGKVISIGSLTSDKIIQTSDGTWLFRGIHDIRRLEIKRINEEHNLVNPNPTWKNLEKVAIIPPYEDEFSSDEEEEPDAALQHNSSDNSVSEEEFDCTTDAASNEPVPTYTARSNRNSRATTSCGQTNNNIFINRRRKNVSLDERRQTEKYIPWAEPGAEYEKAKSDINKLYIESLGYGIVDVFYEKNIFLAKSKRRFEEKKKILKQYIKRRSEKGCVKLTVNADVQFMDNPRYGIRGKLQETKRTRHWIEEIVKFEYRMRTLQLQTCCACRENKIIYDKRRGGARESVRLRSGEVGNRVCEPCKRNKYDVTDHHLKMNLHPIWYEREDDGSIKMGKDNKPIIKYDIPTELKNLTMAEKLLIRRCAPFVPSHHIRNGVYGIFGHCVCFPQNIENMCTDLPQKESNMVIFVRQISDRAGSSYAQHFKVNKSRVIEALRWLKVHHRGYRDITITESNLDWIKNGTVFDNSQKYELRTKKRKRDAVVEAPEAVSTNQCGLGTGEQDGEIETVHPNYKDDRPNPEQSEIIASFKETAKQSNQSNRVLEFPPIDHTKPLK